MTNLTDNLVNLVSGLGTSRDKRSSTSFEYNKRSQADLGILYRNWLFGKVVDIPADDMTRKWRTPKAPSLSIEQLEEFTQAEKELKVRAAVNEALKWARLYGGSAIVMNVKDGLGELSDPLELSRVGKDSLESLVVLDRYDLTCHGVNDKDVKEGFRLPEFYYLPKGLKIHHSRVIRFDGFKLPWDEFQRNSYWGGSVAERVYDEILNTKITTQSIASMIFESSIDVIGVKDLFKKIMTKQSLNSLLTRFELANTTKSINKALIIDKENETFQKVPTNFSALPNLISEFLSVVAAAADIPATRMLGQSAKGFSATGEGDLDNYYDMISSKQETDLYDALGQLDMVLVQSVFGRPVDDWDFEFNPLQQMDEKDIAEINKMDTESAKASYEAGAIKLSHWAAQLLKKGTYPTLDSEYVEALEEVEEIEAEEFANQMNEPEPPENTGELDEENELDLENLDEPPEGEPESIPPEPDEKDDKEV